MDMDKKLNMYILSKLMGEKMPCIWIAYRIFLYDWILISLT